MIQCVIDGFKTLLSDFGPVDIGEFESDLRPTGACCIQITSAEPIQPNVPDWRLTLDFAGLTTADADPDKTLVNALFSGMDAALSALTLEQIATATGTKASLFIPISVNGPSGDDGRRFQIEYQLIIQDFTP